MINVYKIKNGILEKDGKKTLLLGQSYYPSFHPAKYPVPPEGDRIGEMKKDIKAMKEMGFNHIRFAAIGEIYLDDNGEVVVNTPFVDAMIEECAKNDISVSVRLQGYSVNLRGFENVLMIDNNGVEQNTSTWFNFIQTNMCHKGLLEDNVTYSEAVSRHFSKFKNVVGFQIYNEPHFPSPSLYDYHEESIKAYRKWLVEKGVMTKDEADKYSPPRHRNEQDAHMWALWRLFSRDTHTNFLDNAALPAKEETNLPTFTCFTSCPGSAFNSRRGVDLFESARGPMDIVGYTCYVHGNGMDYYSMCYFLDMAASAANAQNKETWCVELDSRTYIPCEIYNKNTFAVLGSGAKAIVYYQWRGDHPSEATPIPNGCGVINYDGSKTPNYENVKLMTGYLNEISDIIIGCKRNSDKIAIFNSDYACSCCDYFENKNDGIAVARKFEDFNNVAKNSVVEKSLRIYTELRQLGYNIDFTDYKNLSDNNLKTKYLFIPEPALLSEEDKESIESFIQKGGKAFELTPTHGSRNLGCGYRPYQDVDYVKMYNGDNSAIYTITYTMYELCEEFIGAPYSHSSNPLVSVSNLKDNETDVLVLTNISAKNKNQSTIITLNRTIHSAKLYDMSESGTVNISDNCIIVDNISDGCIIEVK